MFNFSVEGHDYSVPSKLNAFQQLHVARKLGSAFPIVEGLVNSDNAGKDMTLLTVLMFSHISDQNTEFVINTCMSVVNRVSPDGKQTKITAKDGTLMFDDITMSEMMDITVKVLEDNLGAFFRTALGGLTQVGQAPA